MRKRTAGAARRGARRRPRIPLFLHAAVQLLPAAAVARRDGDRSPASRTCAWLYTGPSSSMLVTDAVLWHAGVARPQAISCCRSLTASSPPTCWSFYLLFKFDPGSRWVAISFFVWLSVVQHVRRLRVLELHGGRVPGRGGETPVRPDRRRRRRRRNHRSVAHPVADPREFGVDGVVGCSPCCCCSQRCPASAAWRAGRRGATGTSCCRRTTRRHASAAGIRGLMLVARSPYLLGIFAIIGIGSIAGIFMYFELLQIAAVGVSRDRRPAPASSPASTWPSTC